ncbi:hypothetical protein E3Q23_01063 [Wallemia mellicola]|uniref:sphinganine-1-phosphate aldolase n=1 Tax=Wallemia mellicola TaxID=1708541 RepID=A0A4T0PQJ3_9BASI|nr:hypothetical protein E3Q23_01063 [Wallemia mellicola]TIB93156.1 PLP-dependent transferase [Wallemia mellicola]TIC12874.1 PLP-dependent transferase [Wallemia mellicola]TIC29540.1 PLP-dependent transferase [Wallemia mellicola]TIC31683.1 PLP-dependent transferase [Wallemia mellicola]
MVVRDPSLPLHKQLPDKGLSKDAVENHLVALGGLEHSKWEEGRVSGAVYYGDKGDVNDIIVDAFRRFTVSNPLHPDVFPGIRTMEAQVVSMVLQMYNAGPFGAGTTTSGGTESILLACLAYRNWAKEARGISNPEMWVSTIIKTYLTKIKDCTCHGTRGIQQDPETRKVSIKHVRRALNRSTCMVVGSAPNFPDGNVDDIVELAKLAKKYGVGLHVDCCLGSFIMPFLKDARLVTTPFDFSVDGVTSISCDTHKYGFAPKGSSVIMYRNKTWRSYQYYSQPDWTGGVYASPTLAGSRPGALIAGTWAVMSHMGQEGYVQSCRDIVTARISIQEYIEQELSSDLAIMGNPISSVVAFKSVNPSLNIYTVGDLMHEKGYSFNAIANPPALHIACTRPTLTAVDDIKATLKWAVEEAKSRKIDKKDEGSMVALYGVGSSTAIGHDLVDYLAKGFLDTMYVVS